MIRSFQVAVFCFVMDVFNVAAGLWDLREGHPGF